MEKREGERTEVKERESEKGQNKRKSSRESGMDHVQRGVG